MSAWLHYVTMQFRRYQISNTLATVAWQLWKSLTLLLAGELNKVHLGSDIRQKYSLVCCTFGNVFSIYPNMCLQDYEICISRNQDNKCRQLLVMAGLKLLWKSISRIALIKFDQICNFVVKKAFCYCYILFDFILSLHYQID